MIEPMVELNDKLMSSFKMSKVFKDHVFFPLISKKILMQLIFHKTANIWLAVMTRF